MVWRAPAEEGAATFGLRQATAKAKKRGLRASQRILSCAASGCWAHLAGSKPRSKRGVTAAGTLGKGTMALLRQAGRAALRANNARSMSLPAFGSGSVQYPMDEEFPGVPVPRTVKLPVPSPEVTTLSNGVKVASVDTNDMATTVGVVVGMGTRHQSRAMGGACHVPSAQARRVRRDRESQQCPHVHACPCGWGPCVCKVVRSVCDGRRDTHTAGGVIDTPGDLVGEGVVFAPFS